MNYGRASLEAVNWKVDIVITHCMPERIQQLVNKYNHYTSNVLTSYFDEIDEKLRFKYWFSGHYHHSNMCDEKHFMIYNNIVQLTDDGFKQIRKDYGCRHHDECYFADSV